MRFSRAMLPACLVALGAVLAAAAGLASPGTALAAKAAKPPATDAAKKVMATISLIEDKLSSTRYQHFTVVNPKKGIFHWDCSGMVEWILGKAAPKARSVLSKKHPTAKEFYTVISNRSTQKPHKGWLRLHGPNSIGPGDVFAWIKPSFWKHRKNTGHVGIVLSAARPHPSHGNVWLLDVADSSRYLHENDSRPPDGNGGYGTGTMAFLFGEDGSALAYGWYGTEQSVDTYVPTSIVFGRVVK
jgi:hypothetical protein